MKKIFLTSAFVLCVFSQALFGVEWPQEDITEASIISDFAQNIGGKISTSIIFEEPAEVKAIKDGKILIVMSDIEDDSVFFPSTLGTCVIVSHEDDLISVYSNLDRTSVKEVTGSKKALKEGEFIGETGNSGWQQERSCLEFQIIDTQKSSAINPKILLPHIEKEKEYNLTGITLQNKEGTFFDLRERKSFPSGSYKVYHTRNKNISPYKMTATINGVIVDEISFDTVSMQNGILYVTGKKQYDSQDIYPKENLILTGEVMLTPGKSILGLTIESFLGKTKQLNYNLSIY